MRFPSSFQVLNIAEKPSVAREITRLLATSSPQKKHSHSQFNPVVSFEFELMKRPCTMIFTSVAGHMMKIDFPAEYRDWNAVNHELLFTAPILRSVDPNCLKLAKNLEVYAQTCTCLVLWLDCDREGEAISFEVVEICKKANPNIEIYRAIFSAVTRYDIMRACETLQRPNKNLSDAVEARMELDLRIGATFTRFLSVRYPRRLDLPSKLISFGPCQFPTLGFVVERYLEIENFIREPFWHIDVSVPVETPSKEKEIVEFQWNRHRLFDRLSTFLFFEICFAVSEALVTDISGKEKTKRRPLPLTTVEMNKVASRHLSMSAHRCMQVAENLYNRGFISYPRTETDKFPKTLNLRSIVEAQTENEIWGDYAKSLLDGGFYWPREGTNNDAAHPPIHPVKTCQRNDCSTDEEWQLYKYVTQHFLACCSDDAIGFESRVEIDIAGEIFHTTGLIVVKKNWLNVFPYEKWTGRQLPKFIVNDMLQPSSINFVEGHTDPPEPLSEEGLIDKMHKNGIGTDATMHEHIHTIEERKYVWKDERSRFFPTKLGVALVKGFKALQKRTGMDLSQPALRSRMESDMCNVANGKVSKETIISSHVNEMHRVFRMTRDNIYFLDEEMHREFDTIGNTVGHNGKIVAKGFSLCGKCNALMDMKVSDGLVGRTSLTEVPSNRTSRGRSYRGATDTLRIAENRFLVCSRFSSGCSEVLYIPQKGDLSANPHRCPYCNFQVLDVVNRNTKKRHTVCPFCFRNPPAAEIERVSTADNGNLEDLPEFRCFMCRHSGCALAIGRNSLQW
ncbi:Dna topoisomerase family protein [Cardiosporidium cionae]|uniref:DNA topoisomerase n=1 Tax=Cardiosporidium cionae TaxID=476202 RepID=A0ABQ7JA92_9APIC|nr:Dna topoisomerase family protein [Cardiosporidium cionae]|eukprot:KAF8820906.1 Dna topoisomerase family protein [Cardiosporidium cionae]